MIRNARDYINALVDTRDMESVEHELSTRHACNCRCYVAAIEEATGGKLVHFDSFRQARELARVVNNKVWTVVCAQLKNNVHYDNVIEQTKLYDALSPSQFSLGKQHLLRPDPTKIQTWKQLQRALALHIKALGILMVASLEDYEKVTDPDDYQLIKAMHHQFNIVGEFHALLFAIATHTILNIQSDDEMIQGCRGEYECDPSLIVSPVMALVSNATALALMGVEN